MYTLLLVDDEPEIREGLQEVVDLAALGFAVAGEAGNGLEGLRLAQELKPDLIITDIRMPLMDGLTMAAEVRKLWPTVQFVILSGYDEFEYARQAIDLTALRYLLKPISAAEFVDVLRDVKRRMDVEFERRRDLSRLRAHFQSSLPLLREQLLSALLAGDIGPAQVLSAAERYGMDLRGQAYHLALIRLPREEASAGSVAIDNPELLSFAVSNIMAEVLEKRLRHHLFHVNGLLAALFITGQATPGDELVQALEEARMTVEHYLDCSVWIGLSAPCATLGALPASLRQAFAALSQSALLEEPRVVCITDTAPGSRDALTVSEYDLRLLGNSLKLGEDEGAARLISGLLAACRDKRVSFQEYRAYLLELLMVFIRTARDLDLPFLEDVQQDVLEQLMLCPAPPQAEEIFQTLCRRFTASVRVGRASSSQALAQQALEYLHQHYCQSDLSLEKVCGYLHISSSYFGALFKKETRKTFSQYLTELRMDQAMNLLVSTDLKTADIAAQVGVGDPGYFSYAFKKHFGLSPSQARRRKEAPNDP